MGASTDAAPSHRDHAVLTRGEPPPRIVSAHYTLRVATDELPQRVELLHRNIVRFGTVTNTLAAACEVTGEVIAEDRDPIL